MPHNRDNCFKYLATESKSLLDNDSNMSNAEVISKRKEL